MGLLAVVKAIHLFIGEWGRNCWGEKGGGVGRKEMIPDL